MNRRVLSWLGWTYVVLFWALLLLPALVIIPASFSVSEMLEFPPQSLTTRWYFDVFSSPDWPNSAWTSLFISAVTAILATGIGLLVAIAQLRFGKIAWPVRLALMSPILIPHVIIATGAFNFLVSSGIGTGQLWPIILIDSTIALPFVLSVTLTAVDGIDPLLWTAASTLGARSLRILRTIILPLIGGALIVSLILAFHAAWDETTFAVFIGPTLNPLLPSRIFGFLLQNITPLIAAIATMLLLATVAGILLVALITHISSRQRQPSHTTSETDKG